MCLGILAVCLSFYCVCACGLQRLEEGVRYLGTGITDSFGLLYECWKLNLGPQEGQQVFLTSESSFHPHLFYDLFLSMHTCACFYVCVCTCACACSCKRVWCPKRPEALHLSGAGGTGGGEPYSVGAGMELKYTKAVCSQLLTFFPGPH